MKGVESVDLLGRRARLRSVVPGDAEPAFRVLHGNRLVLDWLEWGGPADLAEMETRFASWRVPGADADDYTFAVEDARERGFAGALTLRFAGHPHVGAVGYWIDPRCWGRGLATEAVELAAWLAFERLGAVALCARVHHGNEASRRVLHKAGFHEVPLASIPDAPDSKAVPQWALRVMREQVQAREPRRVRFLACRQLSAGAAPRSRR